jgi:hypothetical protein
MMGWKPDEVRAHAVPEFMAVLDGFMEFNGATEKPRAAIHRQLEELMQQYPD